MSDETKGGPCRRPNAKNLHRKWVIRVAQGAEIEVEPPLGPERYNRGVVESELFVAARYCPERDRWVIPLDTADDESRPDEVTGSALLYVNPDDVAAEGLVEADYWGAGVVKLGHATQHHEVEHQPAMAASCGSGTQ